MVVQSTHILTDQYFALTGVIRSRNQTFVFHTLDQAGRLVVTDGQLALDV